MAGPRLNLSGMLGVIALIGLRCGAARSASVYWVSAASWVLRLWLSVGVLRVIYRRGAARVFWVGFAFFGWVYLRIVHTATVSTTFSTELNGAVHRAIDDLLPLNGRLTAASSTLQAQHDHAIWIIRLRVLADVHLNFGFALLGGLLALRFAARGEQDQRALSPEASP